MKNIINFKKGKTVTAVGITAVLIFVGVVCGLNSKTNADEADSVNEPVAEATETAETETAEMPVESKESEVLQNTAGTIAESTTADESEQETADETTVETTAASEETTSETTAASEETKASETTAASEPDGTPENDKSSGPDSKSGPASDENTGSSKEPAPGSDEDSSEYIDTPGGRLYLPDLIEKDKNYKETPVSKTVYLLQDSKVRTGPGYYAFEEVSTMARDTKVEVVAETDSGWYKLDSGYYIEKSHCWDKCPPVIDASGDFASYLKWYIDCPYTFASASVYGFDASGFVMYCYMDYYGISLPHGSNSIWKLSGREVSRDELQVGDIICYDYGDYCGHVAIYIGDGQVIHASSSRGCVCYGDLDMMKILGIKRVID